MRPGFGWAAALGGFPGIRPPRSTAAAQRRDREALSSIGPVPCLRIGGQKTGESPAVKAKAMRCPWHRGPPWPPPGPPPPLALAFRTAPAGLRTPGKQSAGIACVKSTIFSRQIGPSLGLAELAERHISRCRKRRKRSPSYQQRATEQFQDSLASWLLCRPSGYSSSSKCHQCRAGAEGSCAALREPSAGW